MNNIEFANKAKNIAQDYSTLYVLGGFGAPLTKSYKERIIAQYSYNDKKCVREASASTFAFDCVGLIKGILWGWIGDKKKTYGGAKYATNNVPDIGADTMIKACKDVSTDFSMIEIGEVVWRSGHIGIYIGDGLAVESTPAWKNKVQITAVSNIGKKAGYQTRVWTKHGKLPYITYDIPKKSIDEVAKEVIAGKWGNQPQRSKKLKAAGYDYEAVSKRVNEILNSKKSIDEVAKEVIAGKWGNQPQRSKKLKAAGYDYEKVAQRVNEILSSKKGKK